MLIRLACSHWTSSTYSKWGKPGTSRVSLPRILPFCPSLNVTDPPLGWTDFRCLLLPIMCLEQPLSKYHLIQSKQLIGQLLDSILSQFFGPRFVSWIKLCSSVCISLLVGQCRNSCTRDVYDPLLDNNDMWECTVWLSFWPSYWLAVYLL